MATRKSQITNDKLQINTKSEIQTDQLDPKEEKILDCILNGIIVFVLGWLGLGILLSVGGLFHLWG